MSRWDRFVLVVPIYIMIQLLIGFLLMIHSIRTKDKPTSVFCLIHTTCCGWFLYGCWMDGLWD